MRFALSLAAVATLAGSAVAAPPAPNWTKGRPIEISISNDRFTPSTITLRRGAQYILRIHNRSDRKHNFSAPHFFTEARVSPRDSGWVTDDKVDLAAGRSATLHIVAPDTPHAEYAFRSTNLLDAAANMKGRIVVR
ncbi:cupredoxin domain-containing protein [Sphingomonas profundi]|uniref:cupredoxin domain-containing protein n=1 Tax=Alterirhizorhabdus profundi TaxID=2681549 RepID=UPI0018D1F53A|nr:cupredoxin domain-containing protein [Sphingomonas profundi]